MPQPVRTLLAEHAGIGRARGVVFETSPADVHALLEHLRRLRAITTG